jgi:hypothetical protein
MSKRRSSPSLVDHFSTLRDPGQRWRILYPLPEILLLGLCVPPSGIEDFVEIRLWGNRRIDFLRRFLFLPFERGLPAHDTLNEMINGLDAEPFKRLFANWMESCARWFRTSSPSTARLLGEPMRAVRMENDWADLRQNNLCALVWETFDDILDACQSAWRFFVNDPDRIRSIGTRKWAAVSN